MCDSIEAHRENRPKDDGASLDMRSCALNGQSRLIVDTYDAWHGGKRNCSDTIGLDGRSELSNFVALSECIANCETL
jgi:hypothetical protein